MTDQQTADYIKALLRERAGLERAGKADRIAAIDIELRRLGAAGAAPVKRAAKRKSV